MSDEGKLTLIKIVNTDNIKYSSSGEMGFLTEGSTHLVKLYKGILRIPSGIRDRYFIWFFTRENLEEQGMDRTESPVPTWSLPVSCVEIIATGEQLFESLFEGDLNEND